jgi:hypothetical protein
MALKIPTIPGRESYRRALCQMKLSANDRRMLQLHVSAPNHTISMLEMARALWGRQLPGTANLHCGKLAGRLWFALGLPATEYKIHIIGTFTTEDDLSPLTMYPPLVEALHDVGISETR